MSTPHRSFLAGTAIVIGTAIGAGIFGIPAVVARSGVVAGCIEILLLGGLTTIALLAYAEVVARTRGVHQFAGYVGAYLGPRSKWIGLAAVIFGLFGALTAYTKEVGVFLAALLANTVGGSATLYSLVFWVLAGAAVAAGLTAIARFEQILVVGLLGILIVFFVAGVPRVRLENISVVSWPDLLLPYGVVLFAMSAGTAVPELRRYLARRHQLQLMPHILITGMLITTIIYLVTAVVTVGLTGEKTTESAVLGLGAVFGPTALAVGLLFGILAMGSSFIVLGLGLRQLLRYDLRFPAPLALGLTLGVPLAIALSEWFSFIEILAAAGGLLGGAEGVLIWLVWRRARAESQQPPAFSFDWPPFVQWSSAILFVAGSGYELLHLVGFFG
jgi:tyrosine-specific transport protein